MPEVHEVEVLRRAVRLWRSLAVVSWVVLALSVVGTIGLFAVQRDQALRAARAEAEARMAAEQALERAANERAVAEEQLTRAKNEKERLLYFHQLALAQMELEAGDKKKSLEPPEGALKK